MHQTNDGDQFSEFDPDREPGEDSAPISDGKSADAEAAEQRGPGRPPVLDDANRRLLCALLTAGCSRAEAARYAGCTVNTLRRTAARDAAFAAQLQQAEIGRQLNELEKVRGASNKSWRAAAWLLRHYNPRRFSPNRRDLYTHEQVLRIVRAAGRKL
jgi:hypothetical protein